MTPALRGEGGGGGNVRVVPTDQCTNVVTVNTLRWGAGIAQWLERRTRDLKVASSNPCWNGGRIFFSRVDFLC